MAQSNHQRTRSKKKAVCQTWKALSTCDMSQGGGSSNLGQTDKGKAKRHSERCSVPDNTIQKWTEMGIGLRKLYEQKGALNKNTSWWYSIQQIA